MDGGVTSRDNVGEGVAIRGREDLDGVELGPGAGAPGLELGKLLLPLGGGLAAAALVRST